MFSGESSTGYGSSHAYSESWPEYSHGHWSTHEPALWPLAKGAATKHFTRITGATITPMKGEIPTLPEVKGAAEPEKKTFIWKGTEYPSEEAEKIGESEQP